MKKLLFGMSVCALMGLNGFTLAAYPGFTSLDKVVHGYKQLISLDNSASASEAGAKEGENQNPAVNELSDQSQIEDEDDNMDQSMNDSDGDYE